MTGEGLLAPKVKTDSTTHLYVHNNQSIFKFLLPQTFEDFFHRPGRRVYHRKITVFFISSLLKFHSSPSILYMIIYTKFTIVYKYTQYQVIYSIDAPSRQARVCVIDYAIQFLIRVIPREITIVV